MNQPEGAGPVDELAALLGVEAQYYDIWGNLHTTPLETKKAIVGAMGVKSPSSALRERKLRPWNRLIEPVLVVSVNDQPSSLPIHFPLEESREDDVVLHIRFGGEGGHIEERTLRGVSPALAREIEGRRHVRVEIPCETRKDIGYYGIEVEVATPSLSLSGAMRLIVAPERCHVPDVRTWGVSLNLYSVRSGRNWGHGDLGDLREILRWVKTDLGGGFVGINPLHAGQGISPYSPMSRLYGNYLYLDMESLLGEFPEAAKLAGRHSGEIRELNENDLLDYDKCARLKLEMLEAVFDSFLEKHLTGDTPEAREFREYVESEGGPLEDFATFMALDEHLREERGTSADGWRDWPLRYRDPRGAAVEEFRNAHKDRVLFHRFLQWLLDRQMLEVRREAADMPVGILSDLAVGSTARGSDAWSCPGVFAFGVSAGAPPDAFSLNGQNWGFPPLIPEKLRETGYELFIQTIRKNLRRSRALRIDHALGLFRLFWIPEGMAPQNGTYVRYPHEDLLRIIALESALSGASVIAEDLGTIGEEVREALHQNGMLSYRLFYFERDWTSGAFLRPEVYPEMAVTAVTTHDLPTLRGYWSGRDVEVKNRLGIYDGEAKRKDREDRERDRQLMLDALTDLLPEGFPRETKHVPEMSPELFLAIHRFLARTPSRLVSVSLDDIMGALDQQNMPGTLEGYPNWRRKAALGLGELLRNDSAVALARMFREEGRA